MYKVKLTIDDKKDNKFFMTVSVNDGEKVIKKEENIEDASIAGELELNVGDSIEAQCDEIDNRRIGSITIHHTEPLEGTHWAEFRSIVDEMFNKD